MSGERNVSGSGTAQKARTPPHDARLREISVLHDGSFRAVNQSDLAQFFKREQGSARALRLQRAASQKASLSDAIADRRALRRLEKQLSEFDRSANPRRQVRALPREPKARKKSSSPNITITRLSRPLPSYPAPVIDRRGRQGVFLQIEYDSARGNAFGVAARRIRYMFDESHADLVHGKVAFISNMGKTLDEIEAAADVSETASRAARKNAKLGFSAIYQLSAEFDQAERLKAMKRLAANFDERGVPYCMVLHAPSPEGDQRNFHIHVWFSHRPMERIGSYEWAVAEQLRSDLDGPDAMRDLRREWASILTEVSRAKGSHTIFTALSNAARGLPNMPLRKLNRHQVERARRGEIVADVEANRAIIAENCRLADKLRRARSVQVQHPSSRNVLLQELSGALTASPVDFSPGMTARPIVPPVSTLAAAKPTASATVRPKSEEKAPRLAIIRMPPFPAVTVPAPGSLARPQSVNLPRVTSVLPRTRSSPRPVNPSTVESLEPTSVSPSHSLEISVTPTPPARKLRPTESTQPRAVVPQSPHFVPHGLWKPVMIGGCNPKPISETASPISTRIDPSVLLRGRTVHPVDAMIEPFDLWDDGGAERWLVDHGVQAAEAAALVRKAHEIGAHPVSERAVPDPSLPEMPETLAGDRKRAPESGDGWQPRPSAIESEQHAGPKASMLNRLDKLGESLRVGNDRRTAVDPSMERPAQLSPEGPAQSAASDFAYRVRSAVIRLSELEVASSPGPGKAASVERVEQYFNSTHHFAVAGEQLAYGLPVTIGGVRLQEHLERERLALPTEETNETVDIASHLVKLYLFHVDRDEDGFERRKRAQRKKVAAKQARARSTATREADRSPPPKSAIESAAPVATPRSASDAVRPEAPTISQSRRDAQASARARFGETMVPPAETRAAQSLDNPSATIRSEPKSGWPVSPELPAKARTQPTRDPRDPPSFDMKAERQRTRLIRLRGEHSDGLAVVNGMHPKIDSWLVAEGDNAARELAAEAIIADREAMRVVSRLCTEDRSRIRQDARARRVAELLDTGRTPQAPGSGRTRGGRGRSP